jgi:hypothetical protein
MHTGTVGTAQPGRRVRTSLGSRAYDGARNSQPHRGAGESGSAAGRHPAARAPAAEHGFDLVLAGQHFLPQPYWMLGLVVPARRRMSWSLRRQSGYVGIRRRRAWTMR